MQLSDLSVKRPVFAAVMAMLVSVVGLVGFLGLSVREYPDIDPAVVSIQTVYTGAAANVVAISDAPVHPEVDGGQQVETALAGRGFEKFVPRARVIRQRAKARLFPLLR